MTLPTQKEGTLCFLLRDTEVLLACITYSPTEKKWNGIGGFVEKGESPEEAAIRELYREIKVTVYPHDLEKIGYLTIKTLNHNGNVFSILHVTLFLCETWQGEPSVTSGVKPQWFEKDRIPYSDAVDNLKNWLPLILDRERIIVEVLYQENLSKQQTELVDVNIREAITL